MAYDDGYYYGQCKIVAVVDNTADNGKTVLITTDDNKTYSGTIANKKCEFLLPPRTLYTVQKVSSGSTEFTTKVEAGYGDCILVHLDTGYIDVKQGDIVGLDYIKAATDDNLKNKVPEAKAVKELNNSLTKMGDIKLIGELKTYTTGVCDLLYLDGRFRYLYLSLEVTGKNSQKLINTRFIPLPALVYNRPYDIGIYADSTTEWYCNFEVVFTPTKQFYLARRHANNYTLDSLKIYGIY